MKKISFLSILFIFFITKSSSENNVEFDIWKKNFKTLALSKNISEKTFDITMSNVKFLPKVIEYDRFQPEFYEDTKTYVSKRTSANKVKKNKWWFSIWSSIINGFNALYPS